jgi:hypothetical protein
MKRRFTTVTAAAAATLAVAPAASAQLPTSLPQVETPQVQVPQVQTPQVQTPQVEVPQVRTTQVQVSRSAPQLPKAPSPSATPVSSAPSAQSAGASSAGSPSSSESARSGGGDGPSSSPPAGSQSSWGSGRSSSSGRASTQRRSPGERREAAFRRAVRRLQGCLPGLGSFERRVLERRAGIGGRPQSVGAVAHGLHVSVSRVRAAEEAGLTQLRRADRSVGCGAQGGQGGGPPRGSGVAKPAVGVAIAAGAAIVRTFNPAPRIASAIGKSKPRSPRQEKETQGIAGVQAASPKNDGLKLDRGTRHAAATGSDFPLALVLIAAFLLLLPLAALMTLRRRAAAATAGGEVAAAPREAQPQPQHEEPPAPAPVVPPPVASREERRRAVPQPGPSRRDTAIRSSRRVGPAVGAVATRLSGGFRDLGRDVVRRARKRRSRP